MLALLRLVCAESLTSSLLPVDVQIEHSTWSTRIALLNCSDSKCMCLMTTTDFDMRINEDGPQDMRDVTDSRRTVAGLSFVPSLYDNVHVS